MENCFLCGCHYAIATKEDNGKSGLECPNCGHIIYESSIVNALNNSLVWSNAQVLTPAEKDRVIIALRYYYKSHPENSVPKVLTEKTWEDIVATINYPSSILDKINLVLEYFYKKSYSFGELVYIYKQKDYSLFFCKSPDELDEILWYLQDVKCLENKGSLPDGGRMFKITADGIKKIEASRQNINSEQCFVAMWFNDGEIFGPNTDEAYDKAIVPAIESCGYTKYRVDKADEQNGWIPDEIIKEIRRSKFMVADLTGYRAGVYYEAGFADGLNIPVLYTCNEKWFNEEVKKQFECLHCKKAIGLDTEGVHFDLKQRKMILWSENNLEEFKKKLSNKIGAVVGLNEKAKVEISV